MPFQTPHWRQQWDHQADIDTDTDFGTKAPDS